MILGQVGQVITVQIKKFLKFIDSVNYAKQGFFITVKKVENWWLVPTSNSHKEWNLKNS
jgi:hypothetical protein